MSGSIIKMQDYHEYENGRKIPERQGQVFFLAEKVVRPMVEEGLPENLSHLICATTCPDSIAPTLGQLITENFNTSFSECHTIDMVQGCAGGVSALVLGSQLATLHNSTVLVVQADAAKKANSNTKKLNKIFGNGAFACLICYKSPDLGLVHYKTKQFKGLSNLVSVKLGHDADRIIMKEIKDMKTDPRKHLGLSMNNLLAIKLMRKAEGFYLDFIKDAPYIPDIMILHQVNPLIVNHLKSVFSKYNVEFIDIVKETGNCGAASVGLALSISKNIINGKSVFLCSFGTGGVITGGLWKF